MTIPTPSQTELIRTCPTCGGTVEGEPYDIGSGPELSCPNCETCFGALGQKLDPQDATRWIGQDPELRRQAGWENEDGTPALMLAGTPCKQCGKLVFSKWHWDTGTTPVENCAQHTDDGEHVDARS